MDISLFNTNPDSVISLALTGAFILLCGLLLAFWSQSGLSLICAAILCLAGIGVATVPAVMGKIGDPEGNVALVEQAIEGAAIESEALASVVTNGPSQIPQTIGTVEDDGRLTPLLALRRERAIVFTTPAGDIVTPRTNLTSDRR